MIYKCETCHRTDTVGMEGCEICNGHPNIPYFTRIADTLESIFTDVSSSGNPPKPVGKKKPKTHVDICVCGNGGECDYGDDCVYH